MQLWALGCLVEHTLMAAAERGTYFVGRIALQAQQTLEQAQFALERETARRMRLEKKYSELEDRGLVSPRSVSPRIWRPDTGSRNINKEAERSQPPLPRPSSARYDTGKYGLLSPTRSYGSSYCMQTECKAYWKITYFILRSASFPLRQHLTYAYRTGGMFTG